MIESMEKEKNMKIMNYYLKDNLRTILDGIGKEKY